MCLRICACKCIWCQFLVIRRVSGIDVSVSVSVSIAVSVSIFVSVSSSLVDYQWYLVCAGLRGDVFRQRIRVSGLGHAEKSSAGQFAAAFVLVR